jgi:hypothetical protein
MWAEQDRQRHAQTGRSEVRSAPNQQQQDLETIKAQLAMLQAQQAQAAIAAQQATSLAGQTATSAGPDLTTQLQLLGQMHDAGVLTEDEFAAAKAKLLGP